MKRRYLSTDNSYSTRSPSAANPRRSPQHFHSHFDRRFTAASRAGSTSALTRPPATPIPEDMSIEEFESAVSNLVGTYKALVEDKTVSYADQMKLNRTQEKKRRESDVTKTNLTDLLRSLSPLKIPSPTSREQSTSGASSCLGETGLGAGPLEILSPMKSASVSFHGADPLVHEVESSSEGTPKFDLDQAEASEAVMKEKRHQQRGARSSSGRGALDQATQEQTRNTFKHLQRAFSRTMDLEIFSVPRITNIVNESTRSVACRKREKETPDTKSSVTTTGRVGLVSQAAARFRASSALGSTGHDASGASTASRPGSGSATLDPSWIKDSASSRLQGPRHGNNLVSVRAGVAKTSKIQGTRHSDDHKFVSHNIRKEVLAGTTPNRYHVVKDPFETGDELEKMKLKSQRHQLRRGVFHGGVHMATRSPCAITFAPHREQDSAFQQLGRSQIAPIRLRCVLVGDLIHLPHTRIVLGGHTLNPVSNPNATTLSGLKCFQEERRKQLRLEHEARMGKQGGGKNATQMLAQMQHSVNSTSSGPVQTDAAPKLRSLSGMVANNATDGELLNALLGNKKLPSDTGDTPKRSPTPEKRSPTPRTLSPIPEQPVPPLRLHPRIGESEIPGFTPYSGFQFHPHYLLVYEMPNVDPLLLRANSQEALLRVSKQLRKQKDKFTALEFTSRWCCLIEDLQQELYKDGWVRRKVNFEDTSFSDQASEPLTLTELLPTLGNGSVSIDTKSDEDGGDVFCRHSFTFSDQWDSYTTQKKQ